MTLPADLEKINKLLSATRSLVSFSFQLHNLLPPSHRFYPAHVQRGFNRRATEKVQNLAPWQVHFYLKRLRQFKKLSAEVDSLVTRYIALLEEDCAQRPYAAAPSGIAHPSQLDNLIKSLNDVKPAHGILAKSQRAWYVYLETHSAGLQPISIKAIRHSMSFNHQHYRLRYVSCPGSKVDFCMEHGRVGFQPVTKVEFINVIRRGGGPLKRMLQFYIGET